MFSGKCPEFPSRHHFAVTNETPALSEPVTGEKEIHFRTFRRLQLSKKYAINQPSFSLVSLLVIPYDTLLPVFAKVIFKGDASTFGYIRSFTGLGAIGGTFYLISFKPGADLLKVLFVNTFILGMGLILFSHVGYFPLAMVFTLLIGFGAMAQTTICLTIVQVHTDAHMRGRVMSYLIMAMTGMIPLGSLLVGTISQQIGAPNTLLCQGFIAIIIVAAFTYFLRKNKLNKKKSEHFENVDEVIVEEI